MAAPWRPPGRNGLAFFGSILAIALAGCQPPPGMGNAQTVRTPYFALSPTRALAELPVAVPVTLDTRAAGQTPDPATPPPAGSAGSGSDAPPSAGPTPPPGTPRPGTVGGAPGAVTGTQPPTDAPSSPPTDPPPAPPQPADCMVCPSGPRSGVVLADEAPFSPLTGVIVRAGATTVTTNADGSFTLPAPADPGELVTFSAPGRATSAVAGFRDGTLTSHLQRATVTIEGGTGGGSSFAVSGRVVAPNGAGGFAPAAGVDLVVTGDASVSSGPATSAADGSFTMRIFGAQPGVPPAASVWAYRLDDEGDATSLGLSSAALSPGAVLGDIPLAVAGGQVALNAPVTWSFPGTRGWELAMITPSGANFVLARRGPDQLTAPTFTLPGATLEVRAWARGGDGQTAAYWHQDAAASPLTPVLPAPPVPEAALALAPGNAWRWRPVPEVDGYRVQIERLGDGTAFEAYTHLPRLTLPADVPVGPARLRIVAAQEGGLRAVSGLRALRLFGSPTMYASWQGEAP